MNNNDKKIKVKKTMRLNSREKEFLKRHGFMRNKYDDTDKKSKSTGTYDSEDLVFEDALLNIEKTEKLIEETIDDISNDSLKEIDEKTEDDNLIINDVKEIKHELEGIEKELKDVLPKERIKKKSLKVIALSLCICILVSLIGVFQYWSMKEKAMKAEAQKAVNIASNAKEVSISDNLRKHTVRKVKKNEKMKSYSLNEIYNMDMSKTSGVSASELKLITRQGLVGLEEAFVGAEEKYGVNCLFLVAIASMESANGTICFKPNNMFGYGSKGYATKEDNIYDVAKGLSEGYLKPGSSLYNGKTISAVNKRYASSSTWDDKVARNMYNYYSVISSRRNSAINKL
ncbi:glucosaminidase domain-containing protein [Anaerofustis sp.]|uniref:glucosaminidase domain-containing protein n=1 Tax=Anaerofustis sp. TaxID=1872517 RepID=UPI0025B7E4E4|nr:glucosaminidase domain-containing protein [Anaerofustis sp.]